MIVKVVAFIVGTLAVLFGTAFALDRITGWLEGYRWPVWTLMLVAITGASLAAGVVVFGVVIWG